MNPNPIPSQRMTARECGVVALLAAAALLAVGPASAQSNAPTLEVSSGHSLGDYLADDAGRTLYAFDQDTRDTSACNDFCTNTFLPYTIAEGQRPTTGDGAVAALAGTMKRPDGTLQVTYAGHPLYRFGGDTQAGGTAGNGKVAFGGSWFALAPGGEVAKAKPAAHPKQTAQAGGAEKGGADSKNPFAGNADAVAKGKALYMQVGCYGCHGRGGGGGMGPSLVSGNWRYGGTDADLFTTITQGRPKGMPSWRSHFTDDQVWQVISFIRSLGE